MNKAKVKEKEQVIGVEKEIQNKREKLEEKHQEISVLQTQSNEIEEELQKVQANLEEVQTKINKEQKKITKGHYDIREDFGTQNFEALTKSIVTQKCAQIVSQFLVDIDKKEKGHQMEAGILGMGNVSGIIIEIEYNNSITNFEIHKLNMCFDSLREDVSSYFGIPKHIIFFSDANNNIYQNHMNLRESLFPLGKVRQRKTTPRIFVKLMGGLKIEEIGKTVPAKLHEIEEDDLNIKKSLEPDDQLEMKLIAKEVEEMQRKIRKKSLITGSISGFIFLVIFACYIAFGIYQRQASENLWGGKLAHEFLLPSLTSELSHLDKETFNAYMVNEFLPAITAYEQQADLPPNNQWQLNNRILPYARLQQVRAKRNSRCISDRKSINKLLNQLCIEYDSTDYDTEPFGLVDHPYFQYTKEKDHYHSPRDSFNYPSSGYLVELKMDYPNLDELKDIFAFLYKHNWIDAYTVGLVLSINVINYNINSVFCFKLVASKTNYGVIRENLETYIFKITMFETNTLKILAFTIIILSLLSFVLNIYELSIFPKGKDYKGHRLRMPQFFEFLNLISLVLINALFLFALLYKIKVEKIKISEDYQELAGYTFEFDMLFVLQSLLILLLIVSFVKYTSFLIQKVKFIGESFLKFVRAFAIAFGIGVWLLITCYAFMLYMILGETNLNIFSYPYAFCTSIMLFLQGSLVHEGFFILFETSYEYIANKIGYGYLITILVFYMTMAKYFAIPAVMAFFIKATDDTKEDIHRRKLADIQRNRAIAFQHFNERRIKILKQLVIDKQLEKEARLNPPKIKEESSDDEDMGIRSSQRISLSKYIKKEY